MPNNNGTWARPLTSPPNTVGRLPTRGIGTCRTGRWRRSPSTWTPSKTILPRSWCATGELREDRLNADALFGGNALIAITEVEVEPAYAGLDVDQLLTLEAISLLGGGCDLAAMITLDPRRVPRTVASLNSNRLRRFWREAGFESVTQQVMVLYLDMTTLEKHLHRLRTSFALLP